MAESVNTSVVNPTFNSVTAGSLSVECSAVGPFLKLSDAGKEYSFRDHPVVKSHLKMFSYVNVTSVRITVGQRLSLDDTVPMIRFGIVPRGTPFTTSGVNVVGYMPHLSTLNLSSGSVASASVTWGVGPGAVPFPPGVETDLRCVETRHNYLEFFIGQSNPVSGSESDKVVVVTQIDFRISCSGQNFGSIY